jgi:LPS-assembly lipoprotein
MWWSKLSITVLALATLVAACQYQPVYGPDSAANRLRGAISVQTTSGKTGFELTSHLRQLLNDQAQVETPRLSTSLTFETENYGFSASNSATRIALTGTASFSVLDIENEVLQSGSVSETVPYDGTGNEVANRVSLQNASDQIARALAQKIVDALNASAEDWLK